MNLALWIVTGLLAIVYLFAGAVKTIGVLEILGAAGLVLPAALGVAPMLTPLAAAGLAVLMVGAVFTRIRRHEVKPMVADLVYLALAAFVAWGHFFGPESFTG